MGKGGIMRGILTVTEVGRSEVLSGGATKLLFKAVNGDNLERDCFTFKPTVIAAVEEGAEIDVDYEEMKYTGATILKITWLHDPAAEIKTNAPAQSGTWREEKAAEVIGNLMIGNVIDQKHKLAVKLFKWLDESLKEENKNG